MKSDWEKLLAGMASGSVASLARLITRVENREEGWTEAMQEVFYLTGKARVAGITGFGGVGKSTLTNKLASRLVEKGFSVGIVAVDPSSPFSGGALLGDRIRMGDAAALENVFVRSMATRGFSGGISLAAGDVVKILDAFGKDYILVETLGVGQDEIEVMKIAEIVLLLSAPGQGDGIQAIKSGIMEIADIFVVNKADLEGADRMVADIKATLALNETAEAAERPVVKTVATQSLGLSDLLKAVEDRLSAAQPNTTQRRDFIREELIWLMKQKVADKMLDLWTREGGLAEAVQKVAAFEKDPYTLIDETAARYFPQLFSKKSSV